RFVSIALHEPPKAQMLSWSAGTPLDRQAFIVLYQRGARAVWEAVVSLTAGTVLDWRRIPGVQTPLTLDDFLGCEELVRNDHRWREAMRRRGVTDVDLAMIDPWPAGYRGPEDDPDVRRIARPLTFMRSAPDENGYARPVEGLIVLVDLDAMEVLDV